MMATINRNMRLLSRRCYSSLASQKTHNQWGITGMDRESWNHSHMKGKPKAMSTQWIFLGCPGVGKGTYASRLSRLLGIPHIATGDLVREELAQSGPSASDLASIVNKGKLVPDDIIVNLLSRRLEKSALKGETGFILDGFPRTTNQATVVPRIICEDSSELRLACNIIGPSSFILMKQQLLPAALQKSMVTYISSRGHLSLLSRTIATASSIEHAKVDGCSKSDDNCVQEVAPRIKSKRPDKTARHIMQILDKEAVQSVKAEKVIPDIKPGHIIQLKVEVPENKRRVSSLKGIVIARRNAGLNSTFRIRRLVAGVGVESVFPLYSPNIKEVKILDRKRVRRAKLYYLREKMGSSGKK